MLSFKKIGVLSLLLSAGISLGAALSSNKIASEPIHEAKATGEWTESVQLSTIVPSFINAFESNPGIDYLDSASGRYSYFVRHGYLANNKEFEYTKVVASSSEKYLWTDTSTDAQVVTWRIVLKGGKVADGNEDGGIIGLIAHTPMTFSIETTTFGGWPNSGKVNTYVKRSGSSTYTSIQSTTIANTSTEYSQAAVELYAGDTMYFEFFQTNGGGNINYGSTAFKLDEHPVERTITTSDLNRGYYNDALVSDATADYARDASGVFEYGVRHGRLDTKVIEKFDTITADNTKSIHYTQSSDTTNTHAAISYGRNIWTANNDGVIYAIKALDNITFSSSSVTFAGGWFGFYLNYFLLESGKSTLITIAKETYASGSTDPTTAVAPIKLSAGDIMYFEVRYAWSSDPRRSIQDNSDTGAVPTFVVSTTNIASVPVEANTFMAKFMKLAAISTDTEGTGQCITGGWYASAKAAFNAMSADARELFLTDAAYADGAARLIKWAAANGEVINASNLLVTASSNHFFINNSKQSSNIVLIVVIAVAISSLAFMGFAFFSRKRKHL